MSKYWTLSNKPIFTTGIAANHLGIKPKTIINYDNAGMLDIKRTKNNRRVLSRKDIFKILLVKEFVNEKNLTFEATNYLLSIIKKAKQENVDLLDIILTEETEKEFINKSEI